MHVEIARADLARLLTAVDRVVEARTTIPILSNVLLTATDGRLQARGTNLDIEAQASAEATVATPGAITVPARTLKEITGKLPKDALVTIDASAGVATVKSGRSRFKLNTLPPEDYPNLSAGEFAVTFSLSAQDVKTLFGRTAYAMSTEETRYYLNGVFLHVLDGELVAVATDGHQLGRAAVPSPVQAMPSVIIPRQTVGEIQRLAADLQVSLSDNKIRIATGDIVVTSKLVDGTFPDYQRIIPRDNDKVATVDAALLGAAIARVSAVLSKGSHIIKFSLASDGMTLAARGMEGQTAEDEIAVEYTGEPIDIGFNGGYLQAAFQAIGLSSAALRLADPGSPALIKGDDTSLHIIMPARV